MAGPSDPGRPSDLDLMWDPPVLPIPQAWREMVLPHLEQHIADNVDSVSTYMLLYHEVTVTNLIEVGGDGYPCAGN